MRNLWINLAVLALRALCAPEARRFQRSLADPEEAQRRLLRRLVRDLARTRYGQLHRLTGRESYEAFAAQLPIQTYDSLEPWILEQIASGEPVITPHRVVHIEPTSGSSGPVKQIPYTPQLLQSFSNMFRIWTDDQLREGFQPETGRIFMSISPTSGDSGFPDEREYLKAPLRTLVSPFLVLPPRGGDPEDFHERLALTLLRESGLEIISIWSPSYLLVLLDYIESNRETLLVRLPLDRRACLSHSGIRWEAVWPHLRLISCWDGALAEPLARKVRALFPHVRVQGKGLLATEAPITVPLISMSGHVPLLREVFLEFETEEGRIKRLHELSPGEQAQVIVTQQGGLTRYRLNDRVEVRGFARNTPVLAFIGRVDQVCDLAGEKLHARFVCQALLPLIPSGCFMLVPYREKRLGYVLLTGDSQECLPEKLAEKADQALRQAHHYNLAREFGQLAPLQAIPVANLLSRILAFHQSEGMKLGNIKETMLIHDPERGERLLAALEIYPFGYNAADARQSVH